MNSIQVSTTKLCKYDMVCLRPLFNNKSMTYDSNRHDGEMWMPESSYPAEEMPNSDVPFWSHSIPFMFPDKRASMDNMVLEGQFISFDPIRLAEIALLCSSGGGDFLEEFELKMDTGKTAKIDVGFGDWRTHQPLFGERLAIQSTHCHTRGKDDYVDTKQLWLQIVGVPRDYQIVGISVSSNPFLHIFAMTMLRI